MKQIFAHRALIDSQENSIEGISYFAKLGLGMELDLRNSLNGTYLSHEPTGNGVLFKDVCQILSKSKSLVALHIKELDVLHEVLNLINKFSLTNFFIFDSNYEAMCSIFQNHYVGFYANMKPDSNINAQILWCDEVNEDWYSKKTLVKLHEHNKTLYSVSRELVMPSTMDEIQQDWSRLIKLGFDGICTDYPLELQTFWKEAVQN